MKEKIEEFNKFNKTLCTTEMIINQMPRESKEFFNKTLSKHKFKLELYVPNDVIIKHLDTKEDLMRNRLYDFKFVVKSKKDMISKLKTETEQFSKNFKKAHIEGVMDKKLLDKMGIEKSVIERYKNNGYDIKKIFPNKNIFAKSVLLEPDQGNNYNALAKNVQILEIDEDNKFIKSLKKSINGRIRKKTKVISGVTDQILLPSKIKEIGQLARSSINYSKTKGNNVYNLYNLSFKKNKMKNFTANCSNNISEIYSERKRPRRRATITELKKEINSIKSTISNINQENKNIIQSRTSRENSQRNNQKIDNDSLPKFAKSKDLKISVSINNQNYRQTQPNLNYKFDKFNKNNSIRNYNNSVVNKKNKAKRSQTIIRNGSFIKDNDSEMKQLIDKISETNYIKYIAEPVEDIPITKKSKNESKKTKPKSLYLPRNYEVKEIKKLYEVLPNLNYEESHKKLASYFLKFKQIGLGHQKIDNGSNLHGFLNDFQAKTERVNLANNLIKLKNNSGANLNSKNFNKIYTKINNVQETDKQVKNLEFRFIDQLILLNDDFKKMF